MVLRPLLLTQCVAIVLSSIAHADDLAAALAKRAADVRIRGAAIGIISAGQASPVVLEGDAQSPNAQFEIGSLTKVFTGLAASLLSIDGKLDLEAPIAKYVPELAKTYAGTLTAHALGADRTQLSSECETFGDEASLISYLKTVVSAPAPATCLSDLNATILGLVLSRVAQSDYPSLLQTLVLDPLDMHATGFASVSAPTDLLQGYDVALAPLSFSPTVGPTAAARGLYSSPNDLLLFMRLNLSPQDFGDLGRAAALSQKLSLGWGNPGNQASFSAIAVTSDGFSGSLRLDPVRRGGAIVLLNARNAYEVGMLTSIALGGKDLAPDPTFLNTTVAALTGTYTAPSNPGDQIVIKAMGSQFLTMTLTVGAATVPLRIYPTSPHGDSGTFVYLNDGATFVDRLQIPGTPQTLTGTATSLAYDLYEGTDASGQPTFEPLSFARQSR